MRVVFFYEGESIIGRDGKEGHPRVGDTVVMENVGRGLHGEFLVTKLTWVYRQPKPEHMSTYVQFDDDLWVELQRA